LVVGWGLHLVARPGSPKSDDGAGFGRASYLAVEVLAGASLYVASKHAVEGLTKSAALEGAPFGIRVNIVAPGPLKPKCSVASPAAPDDRKAAFAAGVPLKRLGRPEEIAETIVFVASEKASFISGASIPVNGGKAAL
jgi:NAD(P)-dependent dehydrogenase (short-subunit alcohol dehydrogenase family)